MTEVQLTSGDYIILTNEGAYTSPTPDKRETWKDVTGKLTGDVIPHPDADNYTGSGLLGTWATFDKLQKQ